VNRNLLIIGLFCGILGAAVGLMLSPLLVQEDHLQVAGWLELVHRVCTAIGGLGTFVALIIVVRQFYLLQRQSELVQKNIAASMDAQLYARLDSFNRFVFEHSDEYDLLDAPYSGVKSAAQRSKLHRMCDLGFTFFEEIYKHHGRLKMLETEDWEEWEQNLIHFLGKPYVRGYWKEVANRYSHSFQGLANTLVAQIEASGVNPA